VDFIFVETISSSSLSVQWLCPEAVGTFDPILLHYRVQYGSTPSSIMSEIAVRASESTIDIDNCVVMTSVPDLEEGTSYSVRVQALAGGNSGQQSVMTAQAATFGQGKGLPFVVGVTAGLVWCNFFSYFSLHDNHFSIIPEKSIKNVLHMVIVKI